MSRSHSDILWGALTLITFGAALLPWTLGSQGAMLLAFDLGASSRDLQGGGEMVHVASLVIAVGVCWAADRTSRTTVFAIALVGAALAIAWIALLKGSGNVAPPLVALRLFHAIGVAVGYALLGDAWARSRGAGLAVAGVLSLLLPILQGALFQNVNWRDIFSSAATISMAAAVIVVAGARLLTPSGRSWTAQSDLGIEKSRYLIIAAGFVGALSAVAGQVLINFLWRRDGMDSSIVLIVATAGIIGAVAGGWAFDRTYRHGINGVVWSCASAAAISGLAFLACPSLSSSGAVKVAMSIGLAASAFAWLSLFALLQENAPAERRATRSGIVLGVTGVFVAVTMALLVIEAYAIAGGAGKPITSDALGTVIFSYPGGSTSFGIALPLKFGFAFDSNEAFGQLLTMLIMTLAIAYVVPVYLLVRAAGSLPSALVGRFRAVAVTQPAARPGVHLAPTVVTPEPSTTVCPGCGRGTAPHARFCAECGTPLQPARTDR